MCRMEFRLICGTTAVELILCEEKKETGKVSLPGKVKQYFPKGYSNQQIEQVIFELLENWKNSQ